MCKGKKLVRLASPCQHRRDPSGSPKDRMGLLDLGSQQEAKDRVPAMELRVESCTKPELTCQPLVASSQDRSMTRQRRKQVYGTGFYLEPTAMTCAKTC
jgi:hypothetical protein